jgi:Early transcription elongation factor of RNA pol II, NGN section
MMSRYGTLAEESFANMGTGGRVSAISQQSLLPDITDPGIWKVKCKTGSELMLVRSAMLKDLDHKSKGGSGRIKSVFCTGTRGYVYIEALAEPFAKEAITGLTGFYISSFERIPVDQMTSLFNVTVKKKPLKVGQYVRLRRGDLKGDLAEVVSFTTSSDGRNMAWVRAIPRPDFSGSSSGTKTKSAIRPSQQLFNVEEARAKGGLGSWSYYRFVTFDFDFDFTNPFIPIA